MATDLDRPRVLVVDDEYGPRESIAFALRRKFEVDTAADATEAMDRVKQGEYAVVILDICMPEVDGLQALRSIKEMDASVGVVMLTGYGNLQTAQDAIEGGANLFLSKPPRVVELIEAVSTQAQKALLRREEARANAEARELSAKLKREIEEVTPQLWQGRASVELVHDLANPLTVVTGYAGLINEEVVKLESTAQPVAKRLGGYSSVVERAARYCNHLAENWRKVSRGADKFVPVDLTEVIKEVREVIFFTNESIQIESMGPQMVKGAAFELSRVFQNFFRNAQEAGAGEVKVNLRRVRDGIQVTITDDGCGMDAATVHEALKGGYSSKEHGMGIGLSICRHILGTHGAEFSLNSRPGQGTTISLLFPAA